MDRRCIAMSRLLAGFVLLLGLAPGVVTTSLAHMEINGCVIAPATTCPGADLSNASLSNADLTGADLSGASFVDASLVGAQLAGTDLTSADLTRANLSTTNLDSATFSGALLTDTKIETARSSNTTCPDGTNSDQNEGLACLGHLIATP